MKRKLPNEISIWMKKFIHENPFAVKKASGGLEFFFDIDSVSLELQQAKKYEHAKAYIEMVAFLSVKPKGVAVEVGSCILALHTQVLAVGSLSYCRECLKNHAGSRVYLPISIQ